MCDSVAHTGTLLSRDPHHSHPSDQATSSTTNQAATHPVPLSYSLALILAQVEVTFIDRIRATCGILNIGHAASLNKEKPAALQAALTAVRTGAAFRENPFADDVEQYLPSHSSTVTAASSAAS